MIARRPLPRLSARGRDGRIRSPGAGSAGPAGSGASCGCEGPPAGENTPPGDPRIQRGTRGQAVAPGDLFPGLDDIPFDPDDIPAGGPDLPTVPSDPVPGWSGGTAVSSAPSCPAWLPGEYQEAQASIRVTAVGAGYGANLVGIGATLLNRVAVVAVERPLQTFMAQYGIPHATLAVVDGWGRLVHCRAFTNTTVRDRQGLPAFYAGPHTPFRLGSVSKCFTSWTLCRLADLGVIPDMEARLADYVDLERIPAAVSRGEVSPCNLFPESPDVKGWNGTVDARREGITLKHLLTHRSGWYDDAPNYVQMWNSPTYSGDLKSRYLDHNSYPVERRQAVEKNPGVMGKTITSLLSEVATVNRATYPVTHDHMLRYFNLWRLAYSPGSHYVYSNLGYWMLGRVIEAATCHGYESVVRELLLRPLGMHRTRQGANTSWTRGVGEAPAYVQAWPSAGAQGSRTQSYQQGDGSYLGVDLRDYPAYADRDLFATDASGGWSSSAYDLACFLRECFYRRALIRHDVWYDEMLRFQGYRSPGNGTGYGWDLTGGRGSVAYFKSGHLDGGAAYLYHQGTMGGSRPLSLVLAYNRYPFVTLGLGQPDPEQSLKATLLAALGSISVPPRNRDLFEDLAW